MSKDLFSIQAASYARHRPSYPVELIEYILHFVKDKELAWDCATGNGQAAVLLAPYFKKVMATDVSEKQLAQAIPKENISYLLGSAEQTTLPANSFDLITIAQAYHWFQFNDFAKEARRVAKKGAVVAAWGYQLPACGHAAIDQLLTHFYRDTVGSYWDPERKYVEDDYETIPFAFDPLPSKTFSIPVEWNAAAFTGYLGSWSSVQHFIKDRQYNPLGELAALLKAVWPKDTDAIPFSFPLFLKLGRV